MSQKKIQKVVCMGLVIGLTTLLILPTQVCAQEKKLRFRVIAQTTSAAFWVPVKKGVEDAAKQLGVEARFMGPLEFNIAEQRNIIENAIAAGVDGIATTIGDPTAFDNVIQQALDIGIPVITFNTDDPTPNPRMCFIGQDLVEAGRMWARKIVELVDDDGKVLLLTEAPGQTSLEARLTGAKEILGKTNIKYEILDSTTDRVKAMGVIESYYLANPDLSGVFSVDTTGTPAAAHFIKREGLKGKLVCGGFDLTPVTLKAIKDGYCEFTIDQQPYLQGYLPVHQLYLYVKYGISPIDANTGAAYVDRSNVESVMELAEKGYR